MSSMFDGYQDLDNYYVPSNIRPPKPDCNKLKSCAPIKPYEDYNDKNELIGYWWYYGNTVVLEFNINGEITIEDDAIIYTNTTQQPSVTTEGRIGQKAYNIVDLKSWTCMNIIYEDGNVLKYNWVLDSEFVYPEDGQRNVYIDAEDFLKDKQAVVKLYNFRREIIDTKTYQASTNIKYVIDKEFSEKLVRGNYFVSLEIFDETLNATIFYQGPEETAITIK